MVVLVLVAVPGKCCARNTFVDLLAGFFVGVTDIGIVGIVVIVLSWTPEVFILKRALQ